MDMYEAVIKRRSIREFKDIVVPYDVLERCVNAARLAPTAANRQLCEYIIIDDEQLLPKVFDTVGSWAEQSRPEDGGHRGADSKPILLA
ncbi:MAG: nitroreductase family protein [Dehalococcoidales bacterium]|nr:nitroreductase family protein [Dehalococcoidales bacterium]